MENLSFIYNRKSIRKFKNIGIQKQKGKFVNKYD